MVLEEMLFFFECELFILVKLKCKKGLGVGSVLDDGWRDFSSNDINGGMEFIFSIVLMFLFFVDFLGLWVVFFLVVFLVFVGVGNFLVDVFDGLVVQFSLGFIFEEVFFSLGFEDIGFFILEVDELLNKFVCKNNGVLFENQLLQIGVKLEF